MKSWNGTLAVLLLNRSNAIPVKCIFPFAHTFSKSQSVISSPWSTLHKLGGGEKCHRDQTKNYYRVHAYLLRVLLLVSAFKEGLSELSGTRRAAAPLITQCPPQHIGRPQSNSTLLAHIGDIWRPVPDSSVWLSLCPLGNSLANVRGSFSACANNIKCVLSLLVQGPPDVRANCAKDSLIQLSVFH